jgi:cation diffusion facilitator CzcD-associated flavoprotein CzcO
LALCVLLWGQALLSDNYYDALLRDNVSLVPSAVARVTETGVVDQDGKHHDVDVIVWATGASSW